MANLKVFLVLLFVLKTFSQPQSEQIKGTTILRKYLSHVCFYSNQATERGTEVAMYDYAHYLEELYQVRSSILFPRIPPVTNGAGLAKFQSRFNVTIFDVIPADIKVGGVNMYRTARAMKCDFLYIIKDGALSSLPTIEKPAYRCPPLCIGIHAVFHFEHHGNSYAAISEDIINFNDHPYRKAHPITGLGGPPVVPHMIPPVNMTAFYAVSDLRAKLNISSAALVVCRHGALDTFNLDFVHAAVWKLVNTYPADKLHFLFLNTMIFTNHSQINQQIRKYYSQQAAAQAANQQQQQQHAANSWQRHGYQPAHLNRPQLPYNLTWPTRNTVGDEVYTPHPQLTFLPSTVDPAKKEAYYRTCDVMLHARDAGETFGLAIAEMSIHQRPILTYDHSRTPTASKAHLAILAASSAQSVKSATASARSTSASTKSGTASAQSATASAQSAKLAESAPQSATSSKAKPKGRHIFYNHSQEDVIYQISRLITIRQDVQVAYPAYFLEQDWNAYEEYSPKGVMKKFVSWFLEPLYGANGRVAQYASDQLTHEQDEIEERQREKQQRQQETAKEQQQQQQQQRQKAAATAEQQRKQQQQLQQQQQQQRQKAAAGKPSSSNMPSSKKLGSSKPGSSKPPNKSSNNKQQAEPDQQPDQPSSSDNADSSSSATMTMYVIGIVSFLTRQGRSTTSHHLMHQQSQRLAVMTRSRPRIV